jgi:uncharacterized membrane protein YvbJ
MKCTSCQFDNEPGDQFCANCGKPMQAARVLSNAPPFTLRCQSCGTANTAGGMFCENCGAQLSQQPVQSPFSPPVAEPNITSQKSTKTSGAWWILPIVFGLMGGLIAWIVVHDKDERKAKSMLVVGIVMTFVWALIGVAVSLLGYFI